MDAIEGTTVDGSADPLQMAHSLLQSYARDLRDIVAREREKSRELAEANARLQRLDDLKLDFLVFISHELNTPLTAIASVDLLPDASLDEQRDLLEIVRAGHERLSALVEKGLEYFRWLADGRIARPAPISAVELVRAVVAGAADRIRLRVHAPAHETIVDADSAALQRACIILLDNARKFSESEIDVTVGRVGGFVRIEVGDRGIGFRPELAEELFRPFTIADTAHHGRGTGLSLAIGRAIVAGHGGSLTAASAGPGHGASFRIELPLSHSVAAPGELQ